MHKKIISVALVFFTAVYLLPGSTGFADEKLRREEFKEEWTLERYVKYFYNRYSAHFDEVGLKYMAPDYGTDYFKNAATPREIISLAMYYKYRAKEGDSKAERILYSAILETRKKLMERPMITLSFEDAEALFLMVRGAENAGIMNPANMAGRHESRQTGGQAGIMNGKEGEKGEEEQISNSKFLISNKFQNQNSKFQNGEEDVENLQSEICNLQSQIFKWISKYIEAGIKAPDTENRAIISAVHWQYIVDYLNVKNYITNIDRKRYSLMIKNKVDFAIKTNIKKGYWYIEGKDNNFTPHYHAVCAYMLMAYYKLTGYSEYKDIAFAMYENLKRISFDNGMVEARIGHRPCGLGAQFYFMAGMLGRAFEDSDYTTYLFYGFGSRFFSDPNYPNRLEYHSTIEGTEPCFHDDYSFIDAAEIALAIPSLKKDEEKFRFTYMLSAPDIIWSSVKTDVNTGAGATEQSFVPANTTKGFFIQKNNGREIIFDGKKFILGSFGNWAREVVE